METMGAVAYQRADNQHRSIDIVVLAPGDDVPALALGGPTLGHLDRGQISAEVARQLVHGKALAVRGLLGVVVSCQNPNGPIASGGLTLMAALEKARVAVSSRCCASAKAVGSSSATVRATGPADTRVEKAAMAAEYLAIMVRGGWPKRNVVRGRGRWNVVGEKSRRRAGSRGCVREAQVRSGRIEAQSSRTRRQPMALFYGEDKRMDNPAQQACEEARRETRTKRSDPGGNERSRQSRGREKQKAAFDTRGDPLSRCLYIRERLGHRGRHAKPPTASWART